MCGRYASSRKPEDLVELFGVERWEPTETLEPDWNIAPTKKVWAVLDRPVESQPVRQLRALRWGLVPSWSKTPASGVKMINARAETVHEKPAYRRAFASRRCLLPADGYYEWMADPAAKRKQPYFITPYDGSVMAMAGLYEFWRDRTRPDDDPEAWWCTCVVITTDAEGELGRVHPRMPLLVEPGAWGEWLDPARSDADELRGLLLPPAPGQLEVRPVSQAVSDVRNNGPELVARAEPEDDSRDEDEGKDEGKLF